ncbi:hypothetical protein NDU88_005590 [Pleurodeles waltl]|uniref:Uncharacterized protein n=1 Tax=Pleurodeles waltl TaxID=8319 RepID=A0AAV7L7Y8_PLEWA|nr:hypothetical protein NDU88_005590 [Pleurodeles waltl]
MCPKSIGGKECPVPEFAIPWTVGDVSEVAGPPRLATLTVVLAAAGAWTEGWEGTTGTQAGESWGIEVRVGTNVNMLCDSRDPMDAKAADVNLVGDPGCTSDRPATSM